MGPGELSLHPSTPLSGLAGCCPFAVGAWGIRRQHLVNMSWVTSTRDNEAALYFKFCQQPSRGHLSVGHFCLLWNFCLCKRQNCTSFLIMYYIHAYKILMALGLQIGKYSPYVSKHDTHQPHEYICLVAMCSHTRTRSSSKLWLWLICMLFASFVLFSFAHITFKYWRKCYLKIHYSFLYSECILCPCIILY